VAAANWPRPIPTLTAVAVARPVAPLVRGPPRPARVQGVYPRAAYLVVDGRLLALTAADAERLPFGVQVPVPSSPGLPLLGLRVGRAATVGAGRLRLSGSPRAVEIIAGATWDPRPFAGNVAWWPNTVRARLDDLQRLLVQHAAPQDLAALAADADALLLAAVAPPPVNATAHVLPAEAPRRPARAGDDFPGRVRRHLAVFARAAWASDYVAAERAAGALVGLGPGLTPAADDALGGLLAAARFLARALGVDPRTWRALGRRVRRVAHGRTTAVSEALLGCATIGAVGETAGRLLLSLGAAEPAPLQQALGDLLRLGHTSGGDTALGVLLGARLVLARQAALG
jgi:hypothetical protein